MQHTYLAHLIETNPATKDLNVLKVQYFETKLGSMIAIADDSGLYVLDFIEGYDTEDKIRRLRQKLKRPFVSGSNDVLDRMQEELALYFEGKLSKFKTPLVFKGTPFQNTVWEVQMNIPYGETRSYAEIARSIGLPRAYRAVANANKANALAIIVPCHRIIKSDGDLCGYGGGVARKEWLLNLEKTSRS